MKIFIEPCATVEGDTVGVADESDAYDMDKELGEAPLLALEM